MLAHHLEQPPALQTAAARTAGRTTLDLWCRTNFGMDQWRRAYTSTAARWCCCTTRRARTCPYPLCLPCSPASRTAQPPRSRHPHPRQVVVAAGSVACSLRTQGSDAQALCASRCGWSRILLPREMGDSTARAENLRRPGRRDSRARRRPAELRYVAR